MTERKDIDDHWRGEMQISVELSVVFSNLWMFEDIDKSRAISKASGGVLLFQESCEEVCFIYMTAIIRRIG